eukprot:sb/3473100/
MRSLRASKYQHQVCYVLTSNPPFTFGTQSSQATTDIFLALQLAGFSSFGIGAFLVWQVGGYRKRGYQLTGFWLTCIGYGSTLLAFLYIEKLLGHMLEIIRISSFRIANLPLSGPAWNKRSNWQGFPPLHMLEIIRISSFRIANLPLSGPAWNKLYN